jgi:4-amino-4-deoxy-L-arabinose transferase-like glycosyltransferase
LEKIFSKTMVRRLRIEWVLLLLILGIAAFLRFHNLAENPAWYTDEATHVEIARNLLAGETRYFAIEDSFLLFARLPLFEWILAGCFRIFGTGMLTLRALTATLGLLTVILLYAMNRSIHRSSAVALFAALAYAIFPLAVLYNRFGFSYNLLAPLLVLMVWGWVRYRQSGALRWLLLLAGSAGCAAITDVVGWSFLPLLLVAGWGRLRHIVSAYLLALFLPVSYFLWMLLTAPDALVFDLGYTLARTAGSDLTHQLALLANNLRILLTDSWWLVGVIGIVLLRERHQRLATAALLLPLLLVARTVPLYSLSTYYVIPFLPLLALGIAACADRALHAIRLQDSRHKLLGIVLLAVFPLVTTINLWQQAATRFTTPIDAFLLEPDDLRAVAAYLNAQSRPDDLVIASAPLAWMLDSNTADFQMSVAASGEDAMHIPAALPADRYAFDPRFEQAAYIVVDPLWRNWAGVHIPLIAHWLQRLDGLQPVYTSGQVVVYAAN